MTGARLACGATTKSSIVTSPTGPTVECVEPLGIRGVIYEMFKGFNFNIVIYQLYTGTNFDSMFEMLLTRVPSDILCSMRASI